jgi:amidohydrolase
MFRKEPYLVTDFHERVTAALQSELPRAIALRHELHSSPEVSGREQSTLARVIAELPPSSLTETLDDTAAVARVGAPGPSAVAIRAELDALPIVEKSNYRWASSNGAMHACGHDVHLAALVAAARVVARLGAPVPLLAVFQPREETYPSGARDLLASGALSAGGGGITAILGAHVHPDLKVGEIACDAGVVNASSDEFRAEFTGRAGHAAYPHLNTDPILALSSFVVSVQQVVSRNADPMVPSVVTVGAVQGGAVANATPRSASAYGTIRAMNREQRDVMSPTASPPPISARSPSGSPPASPPWPTTPSWPPRPRPSSTGSACGPRAPCARADQTTSRITERSRRR